MKIIDFCIKNQNVEITNIYLPVKCQTYFWLLINDYLSLKPNMTADVFSFTSCCWCYIVLVTSHVSFQTVLYSQNKPFALHSTFHSQISKHTPCAHLICEVMWLCCTCLTLTILAFNFLQFQVVQEIGVTRLSWVKY